MPGTIHDNLLQSFSVDQWLNNFMATDNHLIRVAENNQGRYRQIGQVVFDLTKTAVVAVIGDK